jgi:RNA polymerase sigma factor (sigma-70 family)
MFVDNDKINKALLEKDYQTLINETDPLISMFLHRSGLWYSRVSYRDDLMQEGRLGILSVVDKWDFDGRAQFASFAYIVIRNSIFGYLKKLKWFQEEIDYEFDDDREGSMDEEMKPLTMYGTLVEEMEMDEDADVLKLYYVEEMEQTEIARKLKKKAARVYFIVNRFKDKMRLKYGTMYGLDRTDEGIRQYDTALNKNKNGRLIDTFFINGNAVISYWYNDSMRRYEFFDSRRRTIYTANDCDKLSLEDLIERFGDKNA